MEYHMTQSLGEIIEWAFTGILRRVSPEAWYTTTSLQLPDANGKWRETGWSRATYACHVNRYESQWQLTCWQTQTPSEANICSCFQIRNGIYLKHIQSQYLSWQLSHAHNHLVTKLWIVTLYKMRMKFLLIYRKKFKLPPISDISARIHGDITVNAIVDDSQSHTSAALSQPVLCL